MDYQGTFQTLTPLSLLEQLSNFDANGYLQVFSGKVSWYIFFQEGNITYASHSIEPVERVERHLQRFDYKMDSMLKEAFQVAITFNGHEEKSPGHIEYSTICNLILQQHIQRFQAVKLVEELVKEVIESFSWIREGVYQFYSEWIDLPKMVQLNVKSLIEYCQKRLNDWHSTGGKVWSPYQRAYLFRKNEKPATELPEIQNKLSTFLQERLWNLVKGLSFRELSVLMNQDEIKIVQSLQTYIMDGTVILREPQPPFNQLPKIPEMSLSLEDLLKSSPQAISHPNSTNVNAVLPMQELGENLPITESLNIADVDKYIIVSVDDSPTISADITRFLDEPNFSIVAINDPVKALMQILRIKPNLILLDIEMPNIDGYDLCRLLRKNSLFKKTPIIMVTSNKGIIDRVRANFVGCSGYLTKPFTRSDLLKIVFKHIN